jgi:hypothetical protein
MGSEGRVLVWRIMGGEVEHIGIDGVMGMCGRLGARGGWEVR